MLRKLIKHFLMLGVMFVVMTALIGFQVFLSPASLPVSVWGTILWASALAVTSFGVAYLVTRWI